MEEIRVTPVIEEPEEDDDEPAGGGALSTVAGLGCAVSVGVVGATAIMLVFVLMGDKLSGFRLSSEVAYATTDIEPGQLIRPGDYAFTSGPAMDGAVYTEEQLSGRVAMTSLYAGDPIVEHRLLPPGRREGVASLTPSGTRSLWMKGNAGIDGLGLEPGDHIDIWKTTVVEGDTQVIAEAVPVISFEPASSTSESKSTIATTVEQSDAIAKARGAGATVVITLRSDVEFPAEEIPPPADFGDEGDVYHARRTLQAGVPITEDDLIGLADHGLVPGTALGTGDLVGKIPRRTIYPGERVTHEVIARPGAGGGIAAVLPEGARGIAVSVKHAPDEEFPPGTRVDAHKVLSREGGRVETEQIASNVEIVGNQPTGPECPCIVLLVQPDAVDTILYAREHGDLAVSFTEDE